MLIDPPIDKMVELAGCKYALVCLIAKRARFLKDKKPDLLESSELSSVTFAAKEFMGGKIRGVSED